MQKRQRLLLILTAAVCLVASRCPLYGARLSDVSIREDQQELIVAFQARDCFSSEMEEAILNGVQLSLTFNIEVFEPLKFWPDKAVAATRLTNSIKYDTLKDEFIVFLGDKKDAPIRFETFNEAKQQVTCIRNVSIKPAKARKPGSDYYLRYFLKVDTASDDNKLPFYLDYVFAFLKWGQTKLK